MKLVVMIAVTACGSPQPAPKSAHYAGKPWLKLVEPDNAWSLPIVEASGHFGDHGLATDKHDKGTVRCTTGKLDRIGEAVVAHVKCDKPYEALSISGQWVQQPNGLYHPLIPITQADDLSTLMDDDLLLLDPPHERDSTHSTDSSVHRVEAMRGDGDAWCVADKTSAVGLRPAEFGDRRAFILCMSADKGIVSASEFETNASDKTWHSVQIGDHPMIDMDDPTHPVESD
ncbi:MAG: hypothetical protein QM831_10020 [Kofleriaceae bacterium]